MTSCATIGVLTQPMVLHFYLRPRQNVTSSDSQQSPRIVTAVSVQLNAAHTTDKQADKQPNKNKMKETRQTSNTQTKAKYKQVNKTTT